MAQNIPQTRDDVEMFVNRMQRFGANVPEFAESARLAARLFPHHGAGLKHYQPADACGARDAPATNAIPCPDVQHCAAGLAKSGNNEAVNAFEVGQPARRQAVVYRRNPVVRLDRIF